MKKFFISLFTLLLVFGVVVDGISANSTSALNASYEQIRTHYANNYKSLEIVDEILAVEALGLEVESGGYTYPDLTSLNYLDMSAKDISKNIIALVLLGIDPKNVNGVNLIEIVESSIQSDGSILDPKYGTTLSAIYHYWCVYALKVVDSPKLELAADGLAALQETSDETIGIDNNNGGFGSEWGINTDISGYCIEALSLVNKERYQDTLALSMEYLARKQNSDGGWISDNIYVKDTNSDTMSCVFNGLLAYDREGLFNGKYNVNNINPFDTYLTFQGSDGRFGNVSNQDLNDYSTMGAALALGSYYNESYILKANENYRALTDKKEDEKPVVSVTENKNQGPATNDHTFVVGWLTMMIGSCLVIAYFGKVNEYQR